MIHILNESKSQNTRQSYTTEFKVRKGVRQGCIISPKLCNMYREELINEALLDLKGITVNGVHYTKITFAGDTLIIAKSEEELQLI